MELRNSRTNLKWPPPQGAFACSLLVLTSAEDLNLAVALPHSVWTIKKKQKKKLQYIIVNNELVEELVKIKCFTVIVRQVFFPPLKCSYHLLWTFFLTKTYFRRKKSKLALLNPLMHRRFSDPYFKVL